MKKLLTFLFAIITIAGFSQSITVTVGQSIPSIANADSLAGKSAAFYVDTLNNQNIRGLKVFKDNLVLDSTLGIGISVPDGTAILDITSITKGFLPPRMTTIQRDAITSPAEALTIHDLTSNTPNFFSGTDWKKFVFTPTATLGIIGGVAFVLTAGEIEADANFIWDNTLKRLDIGASSSITTLNVTGLGGASVGGFASGTSQITSPSTLINANAVITGHNSFGGNKQLWYLGSSSSSNDNVILINRQVGSLFFSTSNITRLTIEDAGDIVLEKQIRIKGGAPGVGKVLTSDAVGIATWETPSGGGWVDDGTAVRLSTVTDSVGIGISVPSEKLEVKGNIKIDSSIIYTPISSVPHVEGKVYYDNEDKALSLKTDIVGSTQSLGQEFWTRVINKTGSTISDGSLVFIDGFDVTSGRPTVVLGKADVDSTSNVIGFVTNTMVNNAEGFVTTMGFINDLNTTGFTAGDEIFLSDAVAGNFTSTKPLNAIPVGFITKVDASTGQILATIHRKIVDSPMFAQLSDATNQKPTTTSPTVITFDTNDDIRGITHSVSTATEDIIIINPGTYTIFSQPQVERTSGASAQQFHMWFRIGADDKGGITAVSVANPSQITTDAAHDLTTGQTVEITNVVTTPDINAQHVITVTGATTYTIPVNVTVVTDGVGDWRRILDVNDDVVNSNVELRISGSNDSDVIPLIITREMVVGEKINVMQSVSITTNGIGLVVINPAGEPRIPSIIFAINKN